MSDSNWIKLNRGIWDNFIWDFQKPKFTLAWIDMLLMANYKDKKIMFDGKVEVIKRGSFITSMVKLAERWDMDRGTVKRLLDLLQDDGMITYVCNNRRTAITIVNYSVFQSFTYDDATTHTTADATAEPTADATTHTTQHKKVKKERSLKEGKNIIYADDPSLNEAIISFVEHRKSLKKPMTDNAIKLMINKLNKLSSDISVQIEIINQSILNGWQGIFPLNQQNNQKNVRKEVIPDWMKKKPGFNDFPQSNTDAALDEMEQLFLKEVNRPVKVSECPELTAEAEELKKMLKEKY